MSDLNYKVGVIEAQNNQMKEDLESMKEEMKQDLTKVDIRLASIESQFSQWKSSVGGAIAILVVVGNIVLYFGEGLVNLIKVKLGL